MCKAIEIKGVCHCFGENMVLDNVDFCVDKGEVFGLLGPSGAGKTTLIHILTGQLKACGGESYILGSALNDLSGRHYQQIGMMMDNLGLYERMSCYDNLKFYQMLDGIGENGIDDVLGRVGLLEAKKTPVINLSKGMTNRLAFARAVLRNPKILFLDEPTNGIDPGTALALHKMILEEKEKGTTIFLTTHNMYEAEKLCDNIALLNAGKIVEYGKPSDICRRYNHQKKINVHLKNGQEIVFNHDGEAGAQIKTYLENGEIDSIHSSEPNLETIFIELTGRRLDR